MHVLLDSLGGMLFGRQTFWPTIAASKRFVSTFFLFSSKDQKKRARCCIGVRQIEIKREIDKETLREREKRQKGEKGERER